MGLYPFRRLHWLVPALLACDSVAQPIRAAQPRSDGGLPAEMAAETVVPDGAHCADAADWPPEFASDEVKLLRALNEQRERGIRCGNGEERRRPALEVSPELRCSARLHSKYMFENDDFGRENEQGDFRDRIREAGLSYASAEEAIERSDAEPEGVLDQLLEDWDDCNTLRGDEFDVVGIGRYEEMWTLDFADL